MKKKIFLMRPSLDSNEIEAVRQVFKSKFLTEGKVTNQFESEISKYVKTKFAIATTSATTALHAIFECLNIKGKKVFVSDFTFPATADAIILAGGKPVLVDVDSETMNVTREIIEIKKNDDIQTVLPVSIFGNPLEREFYKLQKKMFIVEDAATSLGTKLGSDFVGSLANVSCFSFHPRKIITTGEGGMITTNDKKIATKIRSFKSFGKNKNKFEDIGTNYKMSDIQSAVGREQLKKIEKIIKNRQNIANIYSEIFEKSDNIQVQKITKNARHTFQTFVCVISKPKVRDKIIKKLAENNIESQIGTYALHCLPAFQNCLKHSKLKNSEFLYKNSLSLPLHEELTQVNQELICNIIMKTLKDSK
jgi:dTDP-4-amino-4,6-dideoxygalactose transaminase